MQRDAEADFDLRECTFVPKTNEKFTSRDAVTDRVHYFQTKEYVGSNGHETSFDQRLQDSMLCHRLRSRQDKSTEQIDFERNSDLCTFTPRTNHHKSVKKSFQNWTVDKISFLMKKCKN
jgi:hypothetical protein